MKILVAGSPVFRDENLLRKILLQIQASVVVHPGFVAMAPMIERFCKEVGITERSYPLERYKEKGYLSPPARCQAMFRENEDVAFLIFLGMGDASQCFLREAHKRGIKTFILDGVRLKHEIALSNLKTFQERNQGRA